MLKGSSSPQKQTTQLRFLNELSAKLQGLLESETLYQELAKIIQTRFSKAWVRIWSVGTDLSLTFQAQAGGNSDPSAPISHTLRNAKGVLSGLIRTGQTSLSDNSQSTFPRSELSLPIIKEGEVIALLHVESDEKNLLDEDDFITLEAVASQISLAITHRRLYHEASRFNTKLQNAVEEKTLELRRAHERILEQQHLLKKENKALKTWIHQESKVMEIIGKSPSILSILSMVDKIAPTTATVLIQGESGTGKELIARRLHFKSDRARNSYITVNCGALQESLLESELFGHEKGSFTGAVSQKVGLCETATGGTLFMDEIGEMSLGIQAKLLRFLQEGEFYRIGGKRPIRVDARVVSATNRDLEHEVKVGRFREDLFYRLNTITLKMPPLKNRVEDIPALVDFFLKNSRFGGSAQQIKKIDPRVLEVFSNYPWPGNIRELQNTIERLKILAENNEIKLEDIPFSIRTPKVRAQSNHFNLNMPLEDVEKNHILETLAYHYGNKTKTAQSLGITIKTLYNKLHRYGILQTLPAPTERSETLV